MNRAVLGAGVRGAAAEANHAEANLQAADVRRRPFRSGRATVSLLGEELAARVARLDLVRRAFRRPLELWLVADLALFLSEHEYDVEVTALCPRAVTPRNLMLIGQKRGAPARS